MVNHRSATQRNPARIEYGKPTEKDLKMIMPNKNYDGAMGDAKTELALAARLSRSISNLFVVKGVVANLADQICGSVPSTLSGSSKSDMSGDGCFASDIELSIEAIEAARYAIEIDVSRIRSRLGL